MAGGPTAKIRLVRCPKCLHVLPEPPDVPVYACGGCGTRLQAKVRESDAGNAVPNSGEENAAQTNKLVHVSNDEVHGRPTLYSEECSLDQSGGSDPITSGSCNSDFEQQSSSNLPIGDPKNGCPHDESGDSNGDQLGGLLTSSKSLSNGRDDSKSSDSSAEQIGGVNLSNEDLKCEIDENESLEHDVEQPGMGREVCSSNGLGQPENEELSPLTAPKAEIELHDDNPVLAKVDADDESKSDSKRSGFRKLDETNGITSLVTAHQPAGENISSDFLTSSPDEQLEQTREGVLQEVDSFVDTSETIDFVNPSSELSGTLIDLSKSPTTRSSHDYYDDGVSSNDGTDDQLPDQQRNSSRSAHKPASHVASNERPKREKFVVNSNFKMQHQLKNRPTVFFEKTNDAMKATRLNQDELFDPMMLGHPSRRRLEDGESSHVPFYHRGSSVGYESPSCQLHDEYHSKSIFSSHDKLVSSDEEKMKLLRMVYELQDQLNNTCYLNDIANERGSAGVDWKNHPIPMYHGRESLEGKNFIYPQHPGRFREQRKWYQQNEFSQPPFSANVRNGRREVEHSWCCCPEDQAQPPPPTLLHDRGFCRIHSGVNYCGAHGSCPSSPKHCVDLDIPLYIRGTKSDDQGHKDHEVKKYKREKQRLVKQLLRPMAGAAPFITCSSCSRQLRLPADFLLFRKRCHQLRCGACGVVLKFSLVDRIHLVPYIPAIKTPPPSEVSEYTDSASQRDLASTSCANESVNCVSKSCSTEGTGRNILYSLPERRKKSVSYASQNKYKYLAEMHESAGPSSSVVNSKKVLSANEDWPARGGSRLHRLMGYSSPSQVIYGGGGASSSGSSSYHPGELSRNEPKYLP